LIDGLKNGRKGGREGREGIKVGGGAEGRTMK
jgi:hypothetical protein